MAQELAFALINPYIIAKSRTGGGHRPVHEPYPIESGRRPDVRSQSGLGRRLRRANPQQ